MNRLLPYGLPITTYTDRHQRLIHVVLDAELERLLLQAQPPCILKPARGRGRGAASETPLAA